MKKPAFVLGIVATLALSPLFVACERTVSKSESTTVTSDGTKKSTEKSVTENPDGTITKKEETKKTTPPQP